MSFVKEFEALDLSQIVSMHGAGTAHYALIDASKMANLVHSLEAFHLAHTCLFDGKAYEDYMDVAPYLVDLDSRSAPADDFLWKIFQDGHGILIFSKERLHELKRHLKKYNKSNVEEVEVFVKFYTAKNFMYVLETVDKFDEIFGKISSILVSDVGFNGEFLIVSGEGA
jgi:Domain of unknown function (DUF4123)